MEFFPSSEGKNTLWIRTTIVSLLLLPSACQGVLLSILLFLPCLSCLLVNKSLLNFKRKKATLPSCLKPQSGSQPLTVKACLCSDLQSSIHACSHCSCHIVSSSCSSNPPNDFLIFFLFIVVLGEGTLWHLQRFLQCINYVH
jgi:hypothetical protein